MFIYIRSVRINGSRRYPGPDDSKVGQSRPVVCPSIVGCVKPHTAGHRRDSSLEVLVTRHPGFGNSPDLPSPG